MIEDYLVKYDLRILGNCKWLVYNEIDFTWVVYERLPYQKKTRTLYDGNDLEVALSILVQEQ